MPVCVDDWRAFSAYCGLAHNTLQSVACINGKNKIPAISDVKMKSLLSMSAIRAIQHDAALKNFYHKRVEEGKNKMVGLNINSNKILTRIFATVKRGTPYVELGKFAT